MAWRRATVEAWDACKLTDCTNDRHNFSLLFYSIVYYLFF